MSVKADIMPLHGGFDYIPRQRGDTSEKIMVRNTLQWSEGGWLNHRTHAGIEYLQMCVCVCVCVKSRLL